MKKYSISRLLLFSLLAEFEIVLTQADSLFAEGWVSDKTAKLILEKYPDSIRLI